MERRTGKWVDVGEKMRAGNLIALFILASVHNLFLKVKQENYKTGEYRMLRFF